MPSVILDSHFRVPAEMVPLEAITNYQTSIAMDEEQINFDFFDHDYDNNQVKFCPGNLEKFFTIFGNIPVEDRRAYPAMTNAISFTGSLRDNQIQTVKQILAHQVNGIGGFGQLDAHPRFGKTVVMTYLTCFLGYKTLFISHQVDLAKQALKTFYRFTNVTDIEYELGRPIIGIIDDIKDIDKFDVCFITYQKFITKKGRQKLDEVADSFGMVLVDEVHKSAAAKYSEVVSKFNSKWRLGVSGTIERKDQLHVINEFIYGPVIAVGKSDQLPCEVYPVYTNVNVPVASHNIKMFFAKMPTYLAQHEDRNNLIVEIITKWADAGHYIVALTTRTDHCDIIANRLKEKGVAAEAYHRKRFKSDKIAREKCLERCRKGETQVLVAYRTMMLGIDVPRWSLMINLMPIANKHSYYQELCRVRTPFEGKHQGYIIDLIDNHHILTGCYKSRKKLYEANRFDIKS